MRHLDWDDAWTFVESESSDADIEAHVASCAECSDRVKQAAIMRRALVDVLTQPVPPAAPETIDHLQTRARDELAAPVPWLRRWRTAPIVAAALVAVVLIGATVSLQSARQQSSAGSAIAASNRPAPQNKGATAVVNTGQMQAAMASSTADAQLSASVAVGDVGGAVQITVVDVAGHPVSGAHVALIARQSVLAAAVTDQAGRTPEWHITVPADPMLQGAFGSRLAAQGVVIVVAWKDGYRSQVLYDTGVFAHGMVYAPRVTLTAGSSADPPQILGSGAHPDYPVSDVAGFAQWVQTAAGSWKQTHSPTAEAGQVVVTVIDEHGQLVPNAHVALVAAGTIVDLAMTGPTGDAALVSGTGVPDWRDVPRAGTSVPRVAAIVVWKDGYTSAVGFDIPLSPGRTLALTAQLGAAGRTALDAKQLAAPTVVPGGTSPGVEDAETALALAQTVPAH